MERDRIIAHLQSSLPHLLAVYAFGSRISGTATANSDLDLAVLVAGYADKVMLFHLASELADLCGHEVDLLDMRAASTIMQYQILTTGQTWWQTDSQVALFEAAVLSEKIELDQARSALLQDIQARGSVYGR